MHTVDATETIGRMIEFFPAAKQMMIRQIMSGVLRGVVSQRLLPAIGGGRTVAIEVMINTARISELIREPERTEEIGEAIEEGGFHHMQSFAQHLVQLVLQESVDFETAAAAATNRHDFELSLQQALRHREAATKAAEAEVAAAAAEEAEASPEADDGTSTLRLAAS